MSYTDRLHYSIYRAASDEFPLMAENLIRQVAVDGHVLRLVIFGSPEDNEQYMERRSFFRGLVQKYFKDCLPVLSYVAQPSLGDGLVILLPSAVASTPLPARLLNSSVSSA